MPSQEKRGGKKDDGKDNSTGVKNYQLRRRILDALDDASYSAWKNQPSICSIQEGSKSDTDKLLDAVEAKMRAEMEEQQRRAKFERLRDKRIKELEEVRVQKWNAHMAEVREAYRKKMFEEEQKANQRRLVQKDKEAEIQAAAEKKKQELERLQRLREQNILLREKERLANMAAKAA
ncbi:unnamed protein product [Cladocopium goreaui]|uniref:Uncharacterized protein n=1 Tax=Cladocopium goreaui TaxID=2562237 RepID=A0A9P1DEN5_9DINO|nr:unnamed protein product [Cladocopium goreaui]